MSDMIEQLKQVYSDDVNPYHYSFKEEWLVDFRTWVDSLTNMELLTAIEKSKHLEVCYDE